METYEREILGTFTSFQVVCQTTILFYYSFKYASEVLEMFIRGESIPYVFWIINLRLMIFCLGG